MKRKRKPRKGEYVCQCRAYGFPHRFGGGRCSGVWLVREQWETCYGAGSCAHCNALSRAEGYPTCEALEGMEDVQVCHAWQQFVAFNEIKVYNIHT